MANFSVTHIHCEGEVDISDNFGMQQFPLSKVDGKVEKQDENTARVLVTSEYQLVVNGNALFTIKSITTYTISNIDLKCRS
jgi:hypothetical protein